MGCDAKALHLNLEAVFLDCAVAVQAVFAVVKKISEYEYKLHPMLYIAKAEVYQDIFNN